MYLRRLRFRALCAAILATTLLTAGCGEGFSLLGGEARNPTLNLSTLGIGEESTHFETFDNNAFGQAELVPVTETPRVIRGRIDGADDVDVYDLGPAEAGTRVLVEMATGDGLSGALALFDETGSSLLVNDHRNVYKGRQAPFIDVVLRRASEHCYVTVAATPGYGADGDYALQASMESGTPISTPERQTVLLVFNGGSGVSVGGRSPVTVPTFDAANISSSFAGQTERMVRLVVEKVRTDYAGLEVEILSTSEGASFDGFMTRIYFGTLDSGLLGLADGVDEYNSNTVQNALVFTDTFEVFSQLSPTVDEMATALANVASHEIGHLLGLVHTHDSDGIMDVTASLNRLMEDQGFRWSPLYGQVYPMGHQDGLQYLLDSVGGALELLPLKGQIDTTAKDMPTILKPPARGEAVLSSCGLCG